MNAGKAIFAIKMPNAPMCCIPIHANVVKDIQGMAELAKKKVSIEPSYKKVSLNLTQMIGVEFLKS